MEQAKSAIDFGGKLDSYRGTIPSIPAIEYLKYLVSPGGVVQNTELLNMRIHDFAAEHSSIFNDRFAQRLSRRYEISNVLSLMLLMIVDPDWKQTLQEAEDGTVHNSKRQNIYELRELLQIELGIAEIQPQCTSTVGMLVELGLFTKYSPLLSNDPLRDMYLRDVYRALGVELEILIPQTKLNQRLGTLHYQNRLSSLPRPRMGFQEFYNYPELSLILQAMLDIEENARKMDTSEA